MEEREEVRRGGTAGLGEERDGDEGPPLVAVLNCEPEESGRGEEAGGVEGVME